MNTELTQQAYNLFHNGTLALARAEENGIRIDLQYCEERRKEVKQTIKEKEAEIYKSKFYKKWTKTRGGTPPNMYSPQQLEKYLYGVLNIKPPKKTKSGKGSTDDETLRELNIPELNKILEIKKLQKSSTTYLKNFEKEAVDGFIHPFFNLNLVDTFRSSSQMPNFQNIPKRDKEAKKLVRGALYARKGHFLAEIDYSSIEVRVAACYHKDPTMIRYLEDPASDMHGDMAQQIFKMSSFDKSIPEQGHLRQAAKNSFVFPQFYGDYYAKNAIGICKHWTELGLHKFKKGTGVKIDSKTYLSDHLIKQGLPSFTRFTEHIKEIERHFWNERFPIYRNWKDKHFEEYQKNGYIESFTGFRFSGYMRKNQVINYPVQSAAFHCLLWSLIELDNYLIKKKCDTRIIGQIHDAIVLDISPKEWEWLYPKIHKIMVDKLKKHYPWIIVPIEVEAEVTDVDQPWSTIHSLESK